jgi:hypothetical protein
VKVAGTAEGLFVGETNDPYVLAVRGYVWGFPLVLAARLRQQFTNPDDPFAARGATSAGAALNNMGHQQQLADPTLAGVAPNVDTLYSLAWLDLRDEPFVLETPDFGSRYYSFQFGHADTSASVSLGARTHGPSLPSVFVRGPGVAEAAPAGMVEVSSHTRYALVAGRILVQPGDAADHEAVRELQRGIRLRPLSSYRADKPTPNPVPEQRLLDAGADTVDPSLVALCRLGNVLRDWVVSPTDRPLIDSFRAIGLTTNEGFRPDSVPERSRSAVAKGLVDGFASVEDKARNLGRNVNGWTVNDGGPRFGDDHLLRAAVAKEQIYVTLPEEALYPVAAFDADGRRLSGQHTYRLTFAAGAWPPAGAFWSITMYGAEGPPLVPNPIDRYAVGDRTPGLVTDADGSLTIEIRHTQPSDASVVNWLPAPSGAFRLMMRLYVPAESAVDGSWVPPPVERVPAV